MSPRRRLTILISMVLAAAFLLVFAPPAAAAGDVAVAGAGRFVVDPAAGTVTVTQSATIRNQKPDSGNLYYYLTGWVLTVPASAQDVLVTSGGVTLRHTRKARPEGDVHDITVALPTPLRYGQQRLLTLTYRLAAATFRSADSARVGVGFASFPMLVAGDPGGVSLEIVAPSSMTFDSSVAFSETIANGLTTRTATGATESLWGLKVALSETSGQSGRRLVEVGHRTVEVVPLPGDTAWLDFTSENFPRALAALTALAGPMPAGALYRVSEDTNVRARGFDGSYNRSRLEIRLSEDLDLTVLCHELAHAWVNGSTSNELWIIEGLAEDLAYRAMEQLRVPASPTTADRTDARAFPLELWASSYTPGDKEAYAYPAAREAVGRLLAGLTADEYARVVGAVAARRDPYAAGGASGAQITWRSLVDTVEEFRPVGAPDPDGQTAAGRVLATWVLAGPSGVDWTARSAARAQYAAIDAADGAWSPPLALRGAMSRWDYAAAAELLPLATEASTKAFALQDAVRATGREVAEARISYENATTAEQLRALADDLGAATEALVALAETDRLSQSVLPTAGLAGDLLGVKAEVDAAARALDEARFADARAAALSARAHANAVAGVSAGLVASIVVAALWAGLATRRMLRGARTSPAAPAAQD